MEKPKSKFLKVVCPRCKNKHILFGKSSTRIKCTQCNKLLIQTTGGKVKIRGKVERVL